MKMMLTFSSLFLLLVPGTLSWYQGYDEMLKQVNAKRQEQGKAALCNSEKIMKTAQMQSQQQRQVGGMTLDGQPGLMECFTSQGFKCSSVGENVGEAQSLDVNMMMKMWIESPHHLDNILGDFSHFGSAAEKAPDGKYYYTQQFAKAMGEAPCMQGAGSGGSTPSSTPSQTPSQPPQQQQPPTQQQPSAQQPNQPQEQQYPGNLQEKQIPHSQPQEGQQQPQQPQQPQDESLRLQNDMKPEDVAKMMETAQPGSSHICYQGKCYKMVPGGDGTAFVPDSYRPPNGGDISDGPSFWAEG